MTASPTPPPDPDTVDGVPAFRRPRWPGEGYAADEVDAFLSELDRALRHEPPTMAPYEVADQRFRVSRRGRRYDLRAVDEHLDRAQARLRQRHGADAVAGVEAAPPEPRHASTWWIYAIALLLVAAVVAFALTQL